MQALVVGAYLSVRRTDTKEFLSNFTLSAKMA